ncbi:hypothetical protein STTU_0980 [Streptomyces sp. Tu6071]|nr:hypothetical protein STTU_0980 [Streptomyces sp. Tu6071]
MRTSRPAVPGPGATCDGDGSRNGRRADMEGIMEPYAGGTGQGALLSVRGAAAAPGD